MRITYIEGIASGGTSHIQTSSSHLSIREPDRPLKSTNTLLNNSNKVTSCLPTLAPKLPTIYSPGDCVSETLSYGTPPTEPAKITWQREETKKYLGKSLIESLETENWILAGHVTKLRISRPSKETPARNSGMICGETKNRLYDK